MKRKLLTIFIAATFTSGLIAPVATFAAESIEFNTPLEQIEDNEAEETENTEEDIEETTESTTEETTVEETTETKAESEVEESSEKEEVETTETSTTDSTTDSTTETSKPKPIKPKPTKPKPSIKEKKESKNEVSITETSGSPVESVAVGEESDVIATNEDNSSYVSTSDINFIKNNTTEEFVESIGDKAREIGQEYDLYASVMIAQAILETGSGNSQLSQAPNHNLFGIKGSYKGDSVSFSTSEDNGKGSLYSINASFRKYPGYKESFEDYAELLTDTKKGNGNFYKETWKKNTKTYKDATKALTGKYATDTSYDKKLNKLIETYDLTFFDQKLNGDARIQNIYYDVKKGDTIESILSEHHIEEKDFQKWNKEILTDKKELKDHKRVIIGQRKISTYQIKNVKTKKTSEFIIPLKEGYTVTSPFGARGGEHHNGVDMAVASNTLIYASSKGKVVAKGFDPSAGNYVILQHENGLFTSYFHMTRSAVSIDEKVEMGDMIGYVGSTGNSTGPHLHFAINTELWSGYINPTNYLDIK
ncbi:peptidoglycan DD-metalloendopeptidase family protein [Vagococcus carniphilus]|uniref:Peptidoglycan hydrolase n=1 Tax=Vagococcus carniphilus TaxID=218144 RepID=A0AAW8U9Y6_9ENTE|nr:glucosaminidase domain-containing protein [Vagococcus carniphilus]MDT2834642.1 peptidoglycan DD-metalloendopeptidase family protein [Vagococcus carniphilus]